MRRMADVRQPGKSHVELVRNKHGSEVEPDTMPFGHYHNSDVGGVSPRGGRDGGRGADPTGIFRDKIRAHGIKPGTNAYPCRFSAAAFYFYGQSAGGGTANHAGAAQGGA